MGIIFEDENNADGIHKVLKNLHDQIPSASNQYKTIYHNAGVAGDQLTVERAVNSLLSISNGFTSKDRLDGIHVEIADWHTDMKFLCVSQMFLENIVIFEYHKAF